MLTQSLVIFAIISTLSMVSITIMQQASAAPQEQKYTSHSKSNCDPDTGEYSYKDGSNSNGPFGHSNCKSSYDSSTGEYESRCKSN